MIIFCAVKHLETVELAF